MMSKNNKLEELKLYVTQKINKEQSLYSKFLNDLDFYVGGLKDTENIKKILEKIYFAKNEILEEILQKIKDVQQ